MLNYVKFIHYACTNNIFDIKTSQMTERIHKIFPGRNFPRFNQFVLRIYGNNN